MVGWMVFILVADPFARRFIIAVTAYWVTCMLTKYLAATTVTVSL
jgi:hypothetical protein